jgi:hypothetical protein
VGQYIQMFFGTFFFYFCWSCFILYHFIQMPINSLILLCVLCQWYSTGLQAGWPGVRVSARSENLSLYHCCAQTASGAHPSSYPMGTRGSFPGGVKRSEREADHSPLSSAEFKNSWSYISIPPNKPSWLGVQLKKHGDNFTFTFTL